MGDFEYYVAGCAFDFAPMIIHVAMLSWGDSDTIALPVCLPFKGEWGKNTHVTLQETPVHTLPDRVQLIFLSLTEQTYYFLDSPLPQDKIYKLWNLSDTNSDTRIYDRIIVGMAPFGGVAVWLAGEKKETLVFWSFGTPFNEEILGLSKTQTMRLCKSYVGKSTYSENALKEKVDGLMKQFQYRYVPIFIKKGKSHNEPSDDNIYKSLFEGIEELLFDGTFDKLKNGMLLDYHRAGKPKKMAVKWNIGKSEYTAYFWMEEKQITTIFDKFYGAHRDTKTDFIIHIDTESKKYELALFHYGLKEPQIIPESAYQLIVFKNKFEDYRSTNYNQPRGAWIW